MTLANLEQYLQQLLATLLPYASTGVVLSALVMAVSRLPMLSIAAMAATCAFLAALLSTGDAGVEIGMAVAAAGGVAGLILLLSGGALWARPSVRPLWRKLRGRVTKDSPPTLYPIPQTLSPRPQPPPPIPARQSLAFRLCAAVVVALAAEALAPVSPLRIGPQETRLALWLVGMGLLAGFSSGSAIVSATGFIVALSAATLVVPDVVTDPTMRPLTYGAIAAVMIIAALGFSFADKLHKSAQVLHRRGTESTEEEP